MALILTPSFTHQPNLVLPLNPTPPVTTGSGLSVRVASQQSGTLGTLTASGQAAGVTWSLVNAPSWVSLVISGVQNTLCTIHFTTATFQPNPYEFYIQATDGVTTVRYPVFLEVKTPLSLALTPASSPNLTVSGITITAESWDSTVADQVINPQGLFGSPANSVQFLFQGFTSPAAPLNAAVPGLQWITGDQTKLVFRVPDPDFANVTVGRALAGGITLDSGSPATVSVPIAAYQAGSFYDEPDRAFQTTLTYKSLTFKSGTLDVGINVYTDPITGDIHFDSVTHYLQGQSADPVGLTYLWTITPTSGTASVVGGSLTAPSVTIAIGGTLGSANALTATLQVRDHLGAPLGTYPVPVFNTFDAGSWAGTNAVKIGLGAVIEQGWIADTINATFSTPAGELAGGENITVTFAVTKGSTLEPTISAPTTIILNSGSPSLTVPITFPAGSLIGYKWNIQATATSSVVGRTGYAQALFMSNGARPLLGTTDGNPIHTIPTSIAGNTGSSIAPVGLIAIDNDPNSPNYQNPVTPTLFELVGAPDGLFIQPVGANFQLVGNALQAGSYPFQIAMSATGYGRTLTPTITLTVTTVQTPLTISGVAANVSSIPDNSLFTINWADTGNALTLDVIQSPSATPIHNVIGTTSLNITQVGTCIYNVYGTSFYGTSYGVPIIVVSSSVSTLGQLRSAPTVASIDENNQLVANWQPLVGPDGTFDQYSGWNISLQNPPSAPVVTFKSATLNPGETESSRSFTTTLTSGTYLMNMQALSNDTTQALNSNLWEFNGTVSNLQFPDPIGPTQVTFDNTSLELGQTVNITLQASYTGADQWQIIYPDNTTTGWLPLSSSVVAKQFQIAGALPIVVQTRRLYTTTAYVPSVVLLRQRTFQIFVLDQQFNPQAAIQGALTGTLGIGGAQGFEIVDATTGTVTPNPWEVVARAIVRDKNSNELKLLVATTRFSNASSLLGTMAIDVFPMEGRPKNLELITPVYENTVTSTTSAVPVKISTTTLPNIVVGKPMAEFQLQATGGNQPYAWYTDLLPEGVKLSINGVLSGTPAQLGVFSINFAVADASTPAYIAESTLSIVVETDLLISNATLPNATVGTPYNTQMILGNAVGGSTVGGLPPYTWEVAAGALPIGITIDPNTGLLSGVPCTYNSTTDFATGKLFTATIQVTDAIGAKASKTYSISLLPEALTLGLGGNVDQPIIFCNEDFKLVVPVFGGFSPYTLLSFADDGVVGSGLQIINPIQINVVHNIASTLIELTAAGGVPPYTFAVGSDGPPYNTTFIPSGGSVSPQPKPNQFALGTTGVAIGSYTTHFVVIDSATPANVFNYIVPVNVVDPAIFQILTQNQEYANPNIASPDAWITSYTYQIGDVVSSGGNNYIAIAQNLSQVPPNVNFWAPYTGQTIIPLRAVGPNPVATWAIDPLTTSMPGATLSGSGANTNLVFSFPGFGSFTVGLQVTDTLGNTLTTTLLVSVLLSRPFQLADGQIEIMVNPTALQVGTHNFNVTVRDSNPISPQTKNQQFTYTASSEIAGVGIGAGNSQQTAYFDHYWTELDTTSVPLPVTPPGAGYSLGTFVPPTTNNGLLYSLNNTNPLAPIISLAGPPTSFTNSEDFISLPIIQGVNPSATLTRLYTSVAHNDQNIAGDIGLLSINSRPILVGDPVGLNPQKAWFNSPNIFKNINWTARVQKGSQLPPGLSLDANTSLIYGVLAGIANPNTSIIEYVDASGTVHGTVTITWDTQQSAFNLSKVNLTTGQILQAYNVLIPTTSQTPITSVDVHRGRLPSGLALSFDGNTPPNLILSGTPTEAGYFDIWFTATNAASQSAFMYFRFAVDYINPLTIVTTSLPSIVTGQPYFATFQGTGGIPPYTWTLDVSSPALPTGITLAPNGILSGTTAVLVYNQNIVVNLTDSETPAATVQATINLNINNTLRITNMPPLPAIIPGQPYFYQVLAEGGTQFGGPGGPYHWAITGGSLPPGISFNTQNGTPIACVPGGAFSGVTSTTSFTSSVTVQVTDAVAATASATAVLATGVASGMLIDTSGVGVINRGVPYLGTLKATGTFVAPTNPSTAITWQVVTSGCASNPLPSGLSLQANAADFGLTAAIVGTYSGPVLVNYPVEILATDSVGHTAVVILQLNTGTDLTITTTSLPTGSVGGSYPPPAGGGYQLTNSGGVGPYTWSIINPIPPVDGLTITSGGKLQGSPVSVTSTAITFQVQDSLVPPNTATKILNLTVQNTTLAITPPFVLSVTSGRPFGAPQGQLAATGGFTPYTWSIAAGSLPSGLSLNASTGVVSGTTTATGTTLVTFRVTDNTGANVSQQFTINVVSGLTLKTGVDFTDGTSNNYLGFIDNGNVTSIPPHNPNQSFYVIASGVVSTTPSQLSIVVGGGFTANVTSLVAGVAKIQLTGPFSAGVSGNNNLSISVTDSGVTATATFKWFVYNDGALVLKPTAGALPTKLTTPN